MAVNKSIPATDLKTDPAVKIAEGQTATIRASGSWNIYNNPDRPCGPPGSGVPAGKNVAYPWPKEGAAEGALLVYVAGALVRVFGDADKERGKDSWVVEVATPGKLELGPNDNKLGDNAGSIDVEITLS